MQKKFFLSFVDKILTFILLGQGQFILTRRNFETTESLCDFKAENLRRTTFKEFFMVLNMYKL